MNKSVIIFFTVLFCACSPKYFVNTENAHIIIDDNNVKHYVNEKLHFSTELSYNDDNYILPTILNKREKLILKKTGFSDKDTILYAGRGSILVLKKMKEILKEYRSINLYDSVISKEPLNQWGYNFYRKTSVDKKHKLFIINDLIPFENKFFQRIEYLETDYNCLIDPTNEDDIIFFSDDYKDKIRLSKDTYHNILQKKIINIKNPYALFEDDFKKAKLFNYRTAYTLENKSNNYYSPDDKSFFDQMLATYYSFADDIAKSDSVWRQFAQAKDTCNCVQTGTISDLLKVILQHKVVMINEAHHIPTHRLLVANLLDTLYKQGFKYLAMEAFVGDSLFNKTGYVSADNGYYLREPNFANLVRKAYKLGFTVLGYDVMTANRDSAQAENIYNHTIKQDSTAKVIVLAGWGHIDKNSMVGEFEKISGVDPLTIDQTFGYNNCKKSNFNNTVVIIQPNKQSINADYFVQNNFNIDTAVPAGNIKIPLPESMQESCKIICIFEKNEFDFVIKNHKIPIPLNIINDTSIAKNLNINLPQGNYYIVYQDNFGNILEQNEILVK